MAEVEMKEGDCHYFISYNLLTDGRIPSRHMEEETISRTAPGNAFLVGKEITGAEVLDTYREQIMKYTREVDEYPSAQVINVIINNFKLISRFED